MAFVLTIGVRQLTENPDRGLDHLERHDHKTGRVHGCPRGLKLQKKLRTYRVELSLNAIYIQMSPCF